MTTREDDRADRKYRQVTGFVAETPWAILPSKLAAIVEMLTLRANGEHLTDDEIQARIGSGPPTRQPQTTNTVAILPLYGVLVQRATIFTKMSGATTLDEWSQAFQAAMANPQIGAVVIDIDSPGGSTDGVTELAAEIRDARGIKPIVAVANTLAASAAYWIGAQADEFVASPSAAVGSIGVYAVHEEVSRLQEMAGITTTIMRAPAAKAEGNPWEPLTEEARAAIQARVEESYGMFVADVAQGRGVSESAVRSGYGQGRVLSAAGALAAGMADRVEAFEDTLTRLMGGDPNAPDVRPGAAAPALPLAASSGLSFAREAEAVRVAADALVERLSSLAEVERGRLTAAKRESLSACPEALREAAQHIDEVLAATDPHKHAAAVEQAHIQFEALQANF